MRMQVRNTSLYNERCEQQTQLGRGQVPPANPPPRKQLSPVSSPVDLQVWPQSSQLSPSAPEGRGPASRRHQQPHSALPPTEQAVMPSLSAPSPGSLAETLPAPGSRAHPCHPRQMGAGDPPTRPKDAARSWQSTGAILGRGAAICQDRRQKSLHMNRAPRSSHQLCSALPYSGFGS